MHWQEQYLLSGVSNYSFVQACCISICTHLCFGYAAIVLTFEIRTESMQNIEVYIHTFVCFGYAATVLTRAPDQNILHSDIYSTEVHEEIISSLLLWRVIPQIISSL